MCTVYLQIFCKKCTPLLCVQKQILSQFCFFRSRNIQKKDQFGLQLTRTGTRQSQVFLSVCLSVVTIKFYLITRFPKIPQGFPRLSKYIQGYPKLPKVTQGYPWSSCTSMSLDVVPSGQLARNSMSLQAVSEVVEWKPHSFVPGMATMMETCSIWHLELLRYPVFETMCKCYKTACNHGGPRKYIWDGSN